MFDFIDIELPESEIQNVFAYRTVLTMSQYAHEHLTMYLEHWNLDYSQIKSGSPIKVNLKSLYGKKEFIGYIHKISGDISPGKNFVEITAMGATVTMKQASQKAWSQVTADQVFTEICKKHQFSFHATPHARIYDHIMQAGKTDWEFLKTFAHNLGYTLRADGAALYFDPLGQDFNALKDSAPYFIMREANDPDGFNLYSFTPIIGETIDYDNAIKAATAVAGIDLVTNDSLVQTNQNRPTTSRAKSQSEFVDRFESDRVIPNSTAAGFESKAADARSQYPYRGYVQVLGDARVRPDMPVLLDGLGNDYNGYWTVLEVKHIVKQTMFITEMLVGTDSLGKAASGTTAPGPIPVRVITANKPSTTKKPKVKLIKNTAPKNNKASNSGFGKTKNRPQPKVATATKGSSSKWVGTSGNLAVVPIKNNASPAAVAKLRSLGVR
jgi:phage protein D